MKVKNIFLSIAVVSIGIVGMAGSAFAATSVQWNTPPNNSSFAVGTTVAPTGTAVGTGTIGGAGLDLALVLDSSGSMAIVSSGKTRQQHQKDAAIALVNALPANTTSVTVIEFDSDANTVRVLTALNPNIAQVIAAINSVDASGGTNIGSGIIAAQNELLGANHTAGRTTAMVVVSDGQSSGSPWENADAAVAAGVNQIHSVGIPGHSVTTMQRIVDGVNDAYDNGGDDHGSYTAFNSSADLANLTAIFSGSGGNLVGLSNLDILLPDGTLLTNVATDGLGNFMVPTPFPLALGPNEFMATATGTDGSMAMASLTLFGTDNGGSAPIPEPSTLLLLGAGLIGLGLVANARKRAGK